MDEEDRHIPEEGYISMHSIHSRINGLSAIHNDTGIHDDEIITTAQPSTDIPREKVCCM